MMGGGIEGARGRTDESECEESRTEHASVFWGWGIQSVLWMSRFLSTLLHSPMFWFHFCCNRELKAMDDLKGCWDLWVYSINRARLDCGSVAISLFCRRSSSSFGWDKMWAIMWMRFDPMLSFVKYGRMLIVLVIWEMRWFSMDSFEVETALNVVKRG